MAAWPRRVASRRSFLRTVGAGLAAAAPAVATAKKGRPELVVGQGPHQYEVIHDWPQLPRRFHWQITHDVAVDSQGLTYVIHEGVRAEAEHDAIFVFDEDGRYVRSFGKEFQGGGHGLEIRREGTGEFLYVCAYKHLRCVAKLDLRGETVWRRAAPIESGAYAAEEGAEPHAEEVFARDRFHPTNTAFLPDGGFFIADGYGSFRVHRHDRDGRWVSCMGTPGAGPGQFNTPHGVWVDDRYDEPRLVIADRANGRLQWFSLDGKLLDVLPGFLMPANIETRGPLMLVPELLGRVTLLDRDNQVVARLGDDSARMAAEKQRTIRTDPARWTPGRFVHPHDAAFDAQGNIFVAEWVATGRLTKLRRIA